VLLGVVLGEVITLGERRTARPAIGEVVADRGRAKHHAAPLLLLLLPLLLLLLPTGVAATGMPALVGCTTPVRTAGRVFAGHSILDGAFFIRSPE
jgi:hypothetical protein